MRYYWNGADSTIDQQKFDLILENSSNIDLGSVYIIEKIISNYWIEWYNLYNWKQNNLDNKKVGVKLVPDKNELPVIELS